MLSLFIGIFLVSAIAISLSQEESLELTQIAEFFTGKTNYSSEVVVCRIDDESNYLPRR